MEETKGWLWITDYNKEYPGPVTHILALEDYSAKEHMYSFLATFVLFAFLFVANKLLLTKFSKTFAEKNDQEKNDIIVLLNANIHHLFCFIFGVFNVFLMCDSPWGLFTADEECLLTYKPFYSHTGIWSMSYLTFDFLLILFLTKDYKSDLGKQTLAHHILAISCIGIGNLAGYAMPKLA
jgi:hypothetical protein